MHEVLPVGSRGIAYEAGELAGTAGLALELAEDAGGRIDLERSAGASTCVVVSSAPEVDLTVAIRDLPTTEIGLRR